MHSTISEEITISETTAPTIAPVLVASEELAELEVQLVQVEQPQEAHLFSQQPEHEPLPQLHWPLGQEACARRASGP